MPKKIIGLLIIIILLIFGAEIIFAKHYARRLCRVPGYTCIKIKRGDSWKRLWPNAEKRRIVMRLNRMNTRLYPGLIIAVPDGLFSINHMDISPMPYSIKPLGVRVVIIDMRKQAFGAYDSNGYLIHWGPVSGGKGWCPDIHRACNTPRGRFYIFNKGDVYCESKKYPVPKGGAPMPYCMYFFNGYAMHASDLPGYHASHGCVRMFFEDAEWLNKHFVRLGRGTKVIIK
jgi:L,D-transpeptidase ErfK/SrfK